MGCCGAKERNSEFGEKSAEFQELDDVLKKYEGIDGSLITILQKTQDIYGYLSVPMIEYISLATKIKSAKIYGVATFYTQFRLKPVGKYLIMLCQGTACHVNGSKRIEEAINEELNISEGETTEDGLFTLNNVACLGCCSLSPVMMINGETYGKLTPEMTKEIIRNLKADSDEEKEA